MSQDTRYESKTDVRRRIITFRNAMQRDEVESLSQRISASVLHWCEKEFRSKITRFEKDTLVLGYMAIRNEVDVRMILWEFQKMGADIGLPRVMDAKRMEFFLQSPSSDLIQSSYKIMEPAKDALKIDMFSYRTIILLLPCVGVNRDGNRLGFGAGYYDRYFEAKLRKKLRERGIALVLIAPVYHFQKDLPFAGDAHDLKVDIVMDETGVYTMHFDVESESQCYDSGDMPVQREVLK